MIKEVSFSFDDGRYDTYTRAYPILKKFGYTATINVVTDFIRGGTYTGFASAQNRPVSVEQLLRLQSEGWEIACHGAHHENSTEDIIQNIADLEQMGIDTDNIGFASPGSFLTLENSEQVQRLMKDGVISYIRSGTQVRREGILYAGLTYVNRKIHNPKLFLYLNKKNIIGKGRKTIFPSVAITRDNTVRQVRYFLEKATGDAVIIMMHSILKESDLGYGSDNWWWAVRRFNGLCEYLSTNDYRVVRTRDIVESF